MDTWTMIATERRRLADDLEQLTAEQWTSPSQCEVWDVRHAAAHVISPFSMGFGTFLAGMIRSGFNIDKMAIARTRKVAASMTDEEIIATLRAEAENRWTPPVPGFGAEIPLSEVVVHGQDIRRPLGLGNPIPEATIEACLAGIKDEKIREDYRERIG